MRRKSLRAIRQQFDLSKVLVELAELPRPLVPVDFFGEERPVELEIGSGKGLFLAEAARERPHHWFLGVELSLRYAMYSALRVWKTGASNVRVIHGDARRVLGEYLPEAVIAVVHIYFPDPWWKKRHHKRRLMTPEFVTQVERVLVPGGLLHFWTDVAEYFALGCQAIRQATAMHEVQQVDESSSSYRTHFERRTLLEGRPVYRARFVRL